MSTISADHDLTTGDNADPSTDARKADAATVLLKAALVVAIEDTDVRMCGECEVEEIDEDRGRVRLSLPSLSAWVDICDFPCLTAKLALEEMAIALSVAQTNVEPARRVLRS